MALKDFASATAWARDLDARWPERSDMRQALVRALAEHCSAQEAPVLAELGIGDGELMIAVAEALPRATIEGVDINSDLIEFVWSRPDAASNFTFRQLDFCDVPWAGAGLQAEYSAVYSLQTFHDLGGREALAATYAEVRKILQPGGVFLNADFARPMPQDDPEKPRRFVPEVHLELLNELGFANAALIGESGMLACVRAFAP